MQREFLVELYYHGNSESEQRVADWAADELKQRTGVRLVQYDLDQSQISQSRLSQIAKYFKASDQQTPAMYGCNRFCNHWDNEQEFRNDLKQLLRMDVYGRQGCPHCAAAKKFLQRLAPIYPGLEIVYYDIISEPGAAAELRDLTAKYEQAAASLPVFHFCRRLIVGFDEITQTATRIAQELERWSSPIRMVSSTGQTSRISRGTESLLSLNLPVLSLVASDSDEQAKQSTHQTEAVPQLPLPDDRLPLTESLPLPGDNNQAESEVLEPDTSHTIKLPFFGALDLRETGMPLLTIAIGLVDGFNPCAMWVLLFLLSILVNIKDRWRMLTIAGTFVLVSGIVYFMFMAAWLTVFMFVGLLRPVQIALALLAIFVGSVHVKDFFAFKKGLTLSIPESAKPGIYARVRTIIHAEHLAGAMLSVVALAIMVNIVELLCTAGLPALYTEILTVQQYPLWKNYAYLLLYNLAYMFDDGMMVLIVVLTMHKTKMQETHGRCLKLLSGLVILILGLIMLIKPEWLV